MSGLKHSAVSSSYRPSFSTRLSSIVAHAPLPECPGHHYPVHATYSSHRKSEQGSEFEYSERMSNHSVAPLPHLIPSTHSISHSKSKDILNFTSSRLNKSHYDEFQVYPTKHAVISEEEYEQKYNNDDNDNESRNSIKSKSSIKSLQSSISKRSHIHAKIHHNRTLKSKSSLTDSTFSINENVDEHQDKNENENIQNNIIKEEGQENKEIVEDNTQFADFTEIDISKHKKELLLQNESKQTESDKLSKRQRKDFDKTPSSHQHSGIVKFHVPVNFFPSNVLKTHKLVHYHKPRK